MLGTRPDIAFAVTKLAQFAANPSKEHLDKAKYVLRYLAGTAKYALVYKGASNKGLIAYTDSDYAADPVKRRSTTGYLFKLANGIISWQSRAQKSIALSATDAEYMALSDCSRQAVWIQNIFTELGLQVGLTQICADNEGGIFIASNPVQERRTKHIDVRFHYVRDLIEQKRIDVVWVPTDENPADMFTKNFGHIKFEKFRSMLVSSTRPNSIKYMYIQMRTILRGAACSIMEVDTDAKTHRIVLTVYNSLSCAIDNPVQIWK
jgi:hypothetical protein